MLKPNFAMKDDFTKLPSSHVVLLQDMKDSVINNRKPSVTPEEERNAVDLILAIYNHLMKSVKCVL